MGELKGKKIREKWRFQSGKRIRQKGAAGEWGRWSMLTLPVETGIVSLMSTSGNKEAS